MPDSGHSAHGHRQGRPARALSWRVISALDINLFIRSARSDARLGRLLAAGAEPATAFDTLYAEADGHDPWASASPRYRYQRRKYDGIVALLPQQGRYRRSLDLGCGAGLLTGRLMEHSDEALGMDISEVAIGQARQRAAGRSGLSFRQGDLLALDPALDHRFDLVVVADALYYLPPAAQTDTGLKALAARFARLLAPGGTLMVVNHYFSGLDADSRRSRRIHDAFTWSPALTLTVTHRRSFWLASLLTVAAT